jgi:hypothetical protein
MNPAAKSYLRHVLIALTPLLAVSEADWRHYGFAAALALVGPLVRALDPDDQAFGVNYGNEKENGDD